MTSSVLWAGGEDINFIPYGQGYAAMAATVAAGGNGQPCIETTANSFRSGFARYAVAMKSNTGSGGPSSVNSTSYARNTPAFTATSFWLSFRFANTQTGGNTPASAYIPIRFADSNGIVRLRLKFTGTNSGPNDTFIVETLNAAGTNVQIGTTSTGRFATLLGYSIPDKIDIFVNYAVAGQFSVYLNGSQVFTFSGDITTNGVTSLSYFDLGCAIGGGQNGAYGASAYSEVFVATRDTRNMSLLTQAPSFPGNTSNWTQLTTGAQTVTTNNSTATGGGFSGGANTVYWMKISPTYTGTASTVQIKLATGFTGTLNMGLYTDDSTGVDPLTLMSACTTITNPTAIVQTATLTTPQSLVAGNTYWVAMVCSVAFTAVQNGSVAGTGMSSQSTSTLPSTASPNSHTNLWIWASIQFTSSQQTAVASNLDPLTPDISSTANQIDEFQASQGFGSTISATTNNSTSTGTNFGGGANTVYYLKVTPASSGTATSVSIRLAGGFTGTLNMGLYTDNGAGTNPATLMSACPTITNPVSAYQAATLTTPQAVFANSNYWVAFVCSVSFSAVQNASVAGSGMATQSSSTLPGTAGAGATATQWIWGAMNYAASASLSVVSVVQTVHTTVGPSGPQHLQFMVRTGSTDYTSASYPATVAYTTITYNWDTNPNTSVAWLLSDLLANSSTFNFGVKSIT